MRLLTTTAAAAVLVGTVLSGTAQAATYPGPFASKSACDSWRATCSLHGYTTYSCLYDSSLQGHGGWYFVSNP